MAKREANSGKSRPLEILGISEPEERVYEYLIEHRGATANEVAKFLSTTPSKAQRLIDSIESKGLVSHTPESPRIYLPIAPDIALNAIMHKHREGLHYAEEAIRKLREKAEITEQRKTERILELVNNPEIEKRIVDEILNMTEHEVLVLSRPPMLVTLMNTPVEEERKSQRQAQKRGVKLKSIVDRSYLELPNAIGSTRADMRAGEIVRFFPELPFKMMLADRRIAVVPLSLDKQRSPALVIRSSALLDALYALFELLWRHSTPITITRQDQVIEEENDSSAMEDAEFLISLLAAGLNDKSAAAELDLSMRTFYRRLERLMKTTNARTRFQLGWNLGISQDKTA